MADDWSGTVAYLRELADAYDMPHARLHADLLEVLRARWEGVVVPRTAFGDLLVTAVGVVYPWHVELHVTARDAAVELRLLRQGVVVIVERCPQLGAAEVLERFLALLVAESDLG